MSGAGAKARPASPTMGFMGDAWSFLLALIDREKPIARTPVSAGESRNKFWAFEIKRLVSRIPGPRSHDVSFADSGRGLRKTRYNSADDPEREEATQ
jgi:hypothetical protein